MATLHGGPASGLHIPDNSEDLEWVATTLNGNGTPIPEQPVEGHALVLRGEVSSEIGLPTLGRRWECYRKVGARPPELGEIHPRDDLPIPNDGTIYRWVCRRREP